MIQKLIIVVCLSLVSFALDLDESDKQKHFAISSILAIGTNQYLYHKTDLSTNERIGYSLLLSNIPGVLKELHDDKKSNNKFDIEDIKANFLGSILGVVLSESFSSFYFDISKNTQNLSFHYKF